MRKGLLFSGIALIIISIILPMVYGGLTLISLGIISMLTLGMDWACCCTVTPILFIVGLILTILGFVLDSK
jgi:hypothetical protein